MLAANDARSNGLHTAQLYPPCASDYEARPVFDVTPATPKAGWRDQHPLYVEHIEWVDHEGISHGLTLRSDDLRSLLADLRLVKSMISRAKQQAAAKGPQQADSATQEHAADAPDVQRCKIHAVDMVRRWSKRTQGHYFGHPVVGGGFCYGREKR